MVLMTQEKKKYVVGKWIKFQMVDDKPIMEQVHKYENLTAHSLNEGMEMCGILQANVLLEKFPPSWSDYRNQLKHKKKNLNLQELISHVRTEEANHLKGEESERLKDKMKFLSLNSCKTNLVEYSCTFVKDSKIGHKVFQCNQRQGQSSNIGGKAQVQANLTEGGDVIADVVVEANMVANKTDCILDTSILRHICANKKLFHDFEESADAECVYMGNSTTTRVMGKGRILLQLTSGKTLALNNVLYVPSLRRNLVSGVLLNKAGLKLVFESDKVVISHGGDFVRKGYLSGGLFVLNFAQEITNNSSIFNSAYIAVSNDL
ncbi:uncharacterized protein LOC142162988 [Nicotiana tabacum]|uniref:Uncharacterized protein LOC142162988 n=1 Tax=Nicotiana tabacum TaxID=4097 RepID=A0AC58RUC7_TOBAC